MTNHWKLPGRRDSEKPLKTFLDVVRAASWRSLIDVKSAYGARLDLAYGYYIFDIGGNKFRLICMIDFQRQELSVRWVGTHAEYDKLCENDGKRLRQL
jgi:mRNA interferase HigB